MKELTASAFLFASQNLTAVLRVLQWGVIALIFIFFLRVIRAVWVEVSPAPIRKSRSERRRDLSCRQPRVSLEPEAHQGETFDLADELTIGRSLGCGVPTPDDIYASTLHARLFRQKDQLWVEDLGSTNGTYVNSERIAQAHRLAKGDVLQAGSTVFEVTR